MIAGILLATGFGLIAYAFYNYVTQNNDFFSKRGLKQLTPTFLLGNSSAFFNGKMTAIELALSLYNAFPNER